MSSPMAQPEPGYCTREDVKRALDVQETAADSAQIDRLIDAASRSIEGMLSRRLYPLQAVRTFDWPNEQMPRAWRLWLDYWELISVTSISNAGAPMAPADYLLRPDWGPPFTLVEINLGGSAAFGGGGTYQRVVSIAGTFGYSDAAAPAGTLTSALADAIGTSAMVSDSSGIGVGALVRVDAERLLVTEKAYVDSGVTVTADVASSNAANTLAASSGAACHVGESLLLDGETMLITKIAGNSLIVKRACDGSPLAGHANGTHIYVPRQLTVVRGAAGSTAATHLNGASLTTWMPPGLVRQLAIAETVVALTAEATGYAEKVSGLGAANAQKRAFTALLDLRDRCRVSFGRQMRLRTA